MLKVYLKQLKEKFHRQLCSVTTGQLSDYFHDLNVSPRSKNNARATVGAFFTFCTRSAAGCLATMKAFRWYKSSRSGQRTSRFIRRGKSRNSSGSPGRKLVPFVAIGAFAGLRTAEIGRLDWSEAYLKERFIEMKASQAKTASRRLVPISDNLAKQIGWLVEDANAGLKEAAKEAGKARLVKWKKNALRYSFIICRVAETQDAVQVALEADNSPQIIFQHSHEIVRLKEAKAWFAIEPETVANVAAHHAALAA